MAALLPATCEILPEAFDRTLSLSFEASRIVAFHLLPAVEWTTGLGSCGPPMLNFYHPAAA